MIWLMSIFSVVLASKKEEACIVIAEKAVNIKSDVLKSISESHPEFRKGDIRRRVVQDIYYHCLKEITPDEYETVEFLKFMSFKHLEHLMYIDPENYKTEKSLELYSFYDKKYQELMKIKSKKMSEITGKPFKDTDPEEEINEPGKNLKNEKRSVKRPNSSTNPKGGNKIDPFKVNIEKAKSHPKFPKKDEKNENSQETSEGLQGESQQTDSQEPKIRIDTNNEKLTKATNQVKYSVKSRNSKEEKSGQEKVMEDNTKSKEDL